MLLLLRLSLSLLVEGLKRVEIVGVVLHVGREGRGIRWWISKEFAAAAAAAALALLAQMAMMVGFKTKMALSQARRVYSSTLDTVASGTLIALGYSV
jgi:hypothetical protein